MQVSSGMQPLRFIKDELNVEISGTAGKRWYGTRLGQAHAAMMHEILIV